MKFSLCPIHLEPLANIREDLLIRLRGWSTKDQLSSEFPILGDVPLRGHFGVDDGAIMLEVGAKAFGRESSPNGVLRHSVGLSGPDGEFRGVGGKLLGEAIDNGAVGKEEDLKGGLAVSQYMEDRAATHGSIRSLEHAQLGLSRRKVCRRNNTLEDLLRDIPQLLMIIVQEQDISRSLGVEGRGNVENSLGDDLLDLCVGDGRLLLEDVVRATDLHGFDEGGGHGCGG